jgi:hypothetical protein
MATLVKHCMSMVIVVLSRLANLLSADLGGH